MDIEKAALKLSKLIHDLGQENAARWLRNRCTMKEIATEQLPQLSAYFNAHGQNYFQSLLVSMRVEEAKKAAEQAEREQMEEDRLRRFQSLPNYKRNAIPASLGSATAWRKQGLRIHGDPIARCGKVALYEKPISHWRHAPEGFESRSFWERKGREVIGQHQEWREAYNQLPAYGLWSLDHTRPRTWRCKGISDEEKSFLRAAEKDKQVYLVYSDWLEERGRLIEASYYRERYS
jgi:uncharacterized protein (TIGR02996 family)